MGDSSAARTGSLRRPREAWRDYLRTPFWRAARVAAADPDIRRERAGLPPWVWVLTFFYGVNPLWAGNMLLLTLVSYPHSVTVPAGSSFLKYVAAFLLHLPLLLLSSVIPWGVLLLGSLSVFFPTSRRRYLEKKYELAPFQPIGPVQLGIYACIRRLMPGIAISANLANTELIAFVYPANTKEARLAIFGGLVLLWQRDRAAAIAVLAHELAHLRRCEALHLGHGSGLEAALRVGWSASLGAIALWFLLGLFNAGLFAFSALDALATAGFLLPLVVAYWCAELQADRLAAEEMGSSAGVIRAIELNRERGGWARRILARLSHPPPAWRRQMLEMEPEAALRRGNFLMLYSFFWRDLIVLATIVGRATLLGHDGGSRYFHGLGFKDNLFASFAQLSGMLTYIFFILVCLLWPKLHYFFASRWSHERVATQQGSSPAYLQPALAALGLGALILVLQFAALLFDASFTKAQGS